jgi:hypothetical protein
MKNRFLIIPFLFVLASLVQLGYVSSPVVSPDQILRPLITLWLFVALLIWPAYWLTRDWNWAAGLLTIFVLGFTFSSAFFSAVLLFMIIVGICWLAFIRLRRLKIHLAHFMYILAGTSIFFTAYAIFLESTMLTHIPWTRYRRAIFDARNYSLPSLSNPSLKRDIYFIVVDGYARSDMLQEMFGFDNSEFITYLREKGFTVPTSSHSNYPSTPLSIASTLNMEYIQTLVPALKQLPQRWLMVPFIDHSRTRALLESQGYQTISISTNWTITDNVTTDQYLHPFPVMLTDFEGFVMDMTPLQIIEPMISGIASLPTSASHREVIKYNFATLADLSEAPGPNFIFSHIISPHPPFVFDQAGMPIDSSHSFTFQDANEFPGTVGEYRQRYIEQVQFVNRQLQKTIDAILAQSDIPPIIILQADHGSGLLTDLTSLKNTCIRERFSPFAAYYLPDLGSDAVVEDVSTVNLFRIILNEYFDAQLPLLESKQYFYKDTQSYYDFQDVTDRLDETCALPKE